MTETKKEIIEDIKDSGVSDSQAAKEEKLDEKKQKPVVKKDEVKKEKPVSKKNKYATKTKKKKETKKTEETREYIIPLRKEFRKVPRYKRTAKAIKAIKEFLAKHMKIRDRDLSKIKLDSYVNEYMWARGIKNPPHKIKVSVKKDSEGIVRAELVDFPSKLKFKKARSEKAGKEAKEAVKKKQLAKKLAEEKKKKEEEKKTAEEKDKKSEISSSSAKNDERKEEAKKKSEEKKKAKAGTEAAQKIAGTQAKEAKKQKQPKVKEPKRPQRKTLAK